MTVYWHYGCEAFDVIELTDRGQRAMWLSDPNLYGWDCCSLLVLKPDVVVPALGARGKKVG